MPCQFTRALAGAFCCAIVVSSSPALAIETTYGEDPVPNSKCTDDFIDLGYGIDPIPAKSLNVRWQEWRAARGLAPTVGLFKRQFGENRYQENPQPSQPEPPRTTPQPNTVFEDQSVGPVPSSRRNARTQNLPRPARVR
jgi:hypothetical protein